MLRRGEDRAGVFNIATGTTATNRNVVGDKCVENDRGVVATSDQEKYLAWTEHYARLVNEEFE